MGRESCTTDSIWWHQIKKSFLSALTGSCILLQFIFLANLCYLYGTQFQNASRTHNLNVLYVDLDGGVVGRSVPAAYEQLKGHDFPTLIEHQPAEYPSPETIYDSVCNRNYWAAIYSSKGASERLSSALYDEAAASNYNSSDALSFIWNGARYPSLSLGFLHSKMEVLIQAARLSYNTLNGTAAAPSIDWSQPVIAQTFMNPISATEINIKPTEQGGRVLYNTVSMVLPILQQFFLLMALNGISTGMQLYSKLNPHRNGLIRLILSVAYTFIGALCMAGYIWAFRESWSVNADQFFLTLVVCWLYMHTNFLIMDVATTYIPRQFMSFFVLTWIIINVSSTIAPLELSPRFYRWGYALPTYEIYEVLVQVWSDGCDNQLYRALPILFSWWLVFLVAAILSLHYRCMVSIKRGGFNADENGSSKAEEL